MKTDGKQADYVGRHLRFGWWSLLVFLSLGVVLELLHGFKVQYYLGVENETRRLMWRLAHAHGGLIGLIHIAFAATVGLVPSWEERWRKLASPCLMAASILLPGGFFLGGLVFYQGDPGLMVLLVPLGAVLLFLGVLLTGLGANTLKGRGKQKR